MLHKSLIYQHLSISLFLFVLYSCVTSEINPVSFSKSFICIFVNLINEYSFFKCIFFIQVNWIFCITLSSWYMYPLLCNMKFQQNLIFTNLKYKSSFLLNVEIHIRVLELIFNFSLFQVHQSRKFNTFFITSLLNSSISLSYFMRLRNLTYSLWCTQNSIHIYHLGIQQVLQMKYLL